MQETLHTISPMTSGLDPKRSKSAIVLIGLGIVVIVGVIIFSIYQKKHSVENKPLTSEQKGELIEDLKNSGHIGESRLTPEQEQNIITAKSDVIARTPHLSDEEKAEIIKQINTR